ncbi:MAG: hypothetical protein EZS28_032858 [Streblomastix strix]|uniref:Uncharacterized protein n=1 Tax=Streblomastix strix TaxID=222440 RepID=A0A5J4UMK6_9EUKA|nr:MAG: hypothetical protein EZS28_032858 [Streblomastix strix]
MIEEHSQGQLFNHGYKLGLQTSDVVDFSEGNTRETPNDLVGMCAALLRFAERSIYIMILMNEGAQGAQQFDPGYNGFMSHALQPLHALRLIQGQGSQDLVNLQAGQYSATVMGPGQQIPQLATFTPTQIIQQLYSKQMIPRPQIQQPFQRFGMYPIMQQFQNFPKPGIFQQTQRSGYSIQLYRQPSFSEGLSQFMQNPPTFALQQIQQSNLLTLPAPNSAGHPTFQSSIQSQNTEQSKQQFSQQPTIRPPTLIQQQQSQAKEPVYINGRLLDSPGTALTIRIVQDLQTLQNKEISQRTDQSFITPVDPQNQQQT